MNRKRLRYRIGRKLPLVAAVSLLLAIVAFYVFGLAWIQSRIYTYYRFDELIIPRLTDATIAVWLIYFCSSIGSFLNVVAWRMPRGEGIGGRSRCPRCANTLATRDNVPVLGWIALVGRCRFCSLPISRRYPIVEATVGLTLTLVGIAELYSLAIPGQAMHWHGGPLWAPRVTPVLMSILAYHALAVSTLWAMALIRMDGTHLPPRLIVFAVIGVVVPMLAYPTLMVVPWQTDRPAIWIPDGLYFDAMMRVITAVVAAAFLGRVLAKGLCPTADLKLDPLGRGTSRLVDLVVMLSIASILIGWQSMPGFILLATVLTFISRPLLRLIPINDGPRGQIAKRGIMEQFSFALPFALTIHLVFWRWLWMFPYWPSDHSDRGVILVSAFAVLAVPLVLRDRKVEAVVVPPEETPGEPDAEENASPE